MKSLIITFLISISSYAQIPSEFVDIQTIDPSIKVELRYFTEWNFIGRVITGYEANKCYLTSEAAHSLALVQEHLKTKGLSLLIFDCYRPQRSVSEFMNWAKDATDQKMQKVYYLEIPKDKLIPLEYIAERSGHSRGSTVDLTLAKLSYVPKSKKVPYQEFETDCRKPVNLEKTGQLHMGTMFDCFSVLSNTNNPKISKEHRDNRMILKNAMVKFGFANYHLEWWHYTLKNEPFKDKFFDFVIR